MACGLLGEQLADGHTERLGDVGNDPQAGIAFAALDAADVGPMPLRAGAEFLLAPTASFAQFSDPLAEALLDRLHGPENSLDTADPSRDYKYYS